MTDQPEMIYFHLHRLVEREISKVADGSTESDSTLSHPPSELSVGAVPGVVQSRKYRIKLAQMLSNLATPEVSSAYENKIYDAITKDEPQVARLIKIILGSEEEKTAAMALKGQEADLFMDALEDIMRDTSFLRESEQLDARRFLISLSKISTNLPQYMFIDGVASVKDKNSYGGTFGDVYRSTYKGKPVALKRLRHFQLEESHRIYQRFCKEALIWQRLYHKFILPFLGIDAENFPRQPCMVSPWMANGTITQFLKHNPKANIDKLLFEISQGIHYLHSQNIVHGDIKGVWNVSTYLLTLNNLYSQSQGNILIDESGQPRLADFGLTIFADGTRHNTTDQGGTLRWMAPELLYPIPGIECYKRTTASDVYAYGCLCIEVYTGRVPFADVRSEIMVLEKVLKGERPERPLGTNAMTDELWNLINACWKHDRASRPKSGLVVDHLKHILRRSATDPAVLPFVDPLPPPTAYSYTSPSTARYFTPFSQTLTMYRAPTRTRPLEEQAAVLRSLKRIRRHADPGRMYHELKLTSTNSSSSSPLKNYAARIKDTNSRVAIKQLEISQLDTNTLTRLADEFNDMRFLHHPNVINYIDLFQHENHVWVVLEDLSNPLYLKKVIVANLNRDAGMKESFITTVLRNVIHAVHYLHRHRISHGSINAEQVLLSYDGHSILVRLKLAAMIPDPDVYSRARRRPPGFNEQTRFETDIWDLGFLAIEMFDSAMSLDFESPELLHDFEIMKPPPSHSLLSFVRATMREIPSEIPSISALFQLPFLKK
ncbi:kinase-like domain-containing protein [Lentinula edodes]|uniref:kinase-like domain-containing protein n=1 Tax=Lentinula edodes TaxID=5353 RepID=UPI001E8CF87D|nr:kinase-like domain-containing protein [Lentinula edodes]KAH7876951.1 kinase-like domain-containing protein [Lentinula edodes]